MPSKLDTIFVMQKFYKRIIDCIKYLNENLRNSFALIAALHYAMRSYQNKL